MLYTDTNNSMNVFPFCFSQVSNQYPELAILKSLLAGLTLPRQTTAEGEYSSGEPTPSVTPSRPASPWTTAQLEPFHKKLKRDNMDGKL